MRIEFIAHATFLLMLDDGRAIVIDPYESMAFDGRFGYPPFRANPDIVVITHEHRDHNYLGDMSGDYHVVRDAYADERLSVTSHHAWHDKFEGAKFGGAVSMMVIAADGIRVCHMGDCGELLSDAQIASLGEIDILLIPVGGYYTLDGDDAATVARRIGAITTIPIHYKTRQIALPIEDASAFLSHFDAPQTFEPGIIDTKALAPGIAVLKPRYGD